MYHSNKELFLVQQLQKQKVKTKTKYVNKIKLKVYYSQEVFFLSSLTTTFELKTK